MGDWLSSKKLSEEIVHVITATIQNSNYITVLPVICKVYVSENMLINLLLGTQVATDGGSHVG